LVDLFRQFDIVWDEGHEATMEVNPDSFNEKTIDAWKSIGINRFSLGVQSLDSRYSKVLDRAHSVDDALKAIKFFKDRNENFSVDLMLGLPFSREWNRNIMRELEELLKYRPNHFSIYILTVKGDYPYLRELPPEDWIEKEYLEVSQFLKSEGYDHYEVSNFSLKGYRSEHNMQYWRNASVAAIGPSATGFLNSGDEGIRYKWKPTQVEFSKEVLGPEQLALEDVYLGLRTSEGHKTDDPRFIDLATKWAHKGLAQMPSRGIISLTSKGYLLLDSLMDELFREKII
jgi:oxygen-independent coproporphyrinogen-3 oxidase